MGIARQGPPVGQLLSPNVSYQVHRLESTLDALAAFAPEGSIGSP